MINGCKLTIILVLALFVLSCRQQEFAQPSCRVNANSVSTHQGPGACVIKMNNKLLVTQLTSRLYDLPIAQLSSNNEARFTSSQCLAHQGMWQQTGLNVEVQSVVGAQADGTWLFGCTVSAGFDGTEAPFDAPPWSSHSVDKIAFVDPFEIDAHHWARKRQFTIVRDAFILRGVQADNR
jgi:hypothetical protein